MARSPYLRGSSLYFLRSSGMTVFPETVPSSWRAVLHKERAFSHTRRLLRFRFADPEGPFRFHRSRNHHWHSMCFHRLGSEAPRDDDMFGTRIDLFKVFGIPVRVDLSWFLIVLLISWSLATAVFPQYFKDLPNAVYWAMGLAGALGLFVSILLHELSHCVVAKRYGVSIRGITLFIFGGVAEMEDEPPSAKAEFWVAVAGPIASILIAATAFVGAVAGEAFGGAAPVLGVVWYLAFINTVLVIFNVIPAFPLDGGRVLRSIIWQIRGDLRGATRVTASIGSGFGLFLIALGVLHIIGGNFIGGMWYFLIGMFLRGAAQASYQHVLVRHALAGKTISRFMQTDVVTVPSAMSVQELVEDVVYRYQHKLYPVVASGQLLGCVTTRQVKDVPRNDWPVVKVGQIARSVSRENSIEPWADATEALARMSENESSRLMVVAEGRLCGVVALKDLLQFITLKIELEDEIAAPQTPLHQQRSQRSLHDKANQEPVHTTRL